jgi:hypothetical protein
MSTLEPVPSLHMPTTHRWVVDAIQEYSASIEVDGGAMVTMPRWLLPDSAREVDVLRVTHERPAKGQRSALTIDVTP